ncbi:hypothetical protein PTTG_07089 [Puccinia triticina 1-1 BBBD Race 1]|uniref:Uncharacterized protein n=1 Tax=Puccinia triticina (isolate 1-1 / race 1 (BBBD)) TaxID=630390 RepID=A0A180FZX0_PUCT1|nr:hypothetical protein PTTG_07089 [Puccinia triticina 1-1 BBBD Race 1]
MLSRRSSHPYSLRPWASSAATRPGSPTMNSIEVNRNILNHHPLRQQSILGSEAILEPHSPSSPDRMQWARERMDFFSVGVPPRRSASPMTCRPSVADELVIPSVGTAPPSVEAPFIAGAPANPPELVGLPPRFRAPTPFPVDSSEVAGPDPASPEYCPRSPGWRPLGNSPVYRPGALSMPQSPGLSSNQVVFDNSWLDEASWIWDPVVHRQSTPLVDHQQPIEVDPSVSNNLRASPEVVPIDTRSNTKNNNGASEDHHSNPDFPRIPSPIHRGDYSITELPFLQPHQIGALLTRDVGQAPPHTAVEPAALFHMYTSFVEGFITYSNQSPSTSEFDHLERVALFQHWGRRYLEGDYSLRQNHY